MKPWIPEINDWVTYPNPLNGELSLGKVSGRFKSRDGKITIAVEGYRIPLEDCAPPSFDMASLFYQELLEKCALIGELADALEGDTT